MNRVQHERRGANITQKQAAKEAGVGVDVFREAEGGGKRLPCPDRGNGGHKAMRGKKRRIAPGPVRSQPKSYGNCAACGKSVGEWGWVVNGRGQTLHYGYGRGDTCFRALQNVKEAAK